MDSFLDQLRERVLVFDGAAGTNLQLAGLTLDDFGGPELEGCNEILNLTRPDVIAGLHDSFFAVGWRKPRSTCGAMPRWPTRLAIRRSST